MPCEPPACEPGVPPSGQSRCTSFAHAGPLAPCSKTGCVHRHEGAARSADAASEALVRAAHQYLERQQRVAAVRLQLRLLVGVVAADSVATAFSIRHGQICPHKLAGRCAKARVGLTAIRSSTSIDIHFQRSGERVSRRTARSSRGAAASSSGLIRPQSELAARRRRRERRAGQQPPASPRRAAARSTARKGSGRPCRAVVGPRLGLDAPRSACP